MTYLTDEQVTKLLGAIHPGRVHGDDKGFSHVQAYEIRAHLNRLFGFARWSGDVIEYRLSYEDSRPRLTREGEPMLDQRTKQPKVGWFVGYTAMYTLAVKAPDGTLLATYTEVAAGAAENQPSRGDAHDLAIKSAESQALKRCAANLGDQFGLSLYRGGSTDPIVSRTLVRPDSSAVVGQDSDVDLQGPGVEAPANEAAAQARVNTIRAKPVQGWAASGSEEA